ncbi:hypothetical protein GQ53DRAFT_505680 [Thozetella sp. PMI_491]|nr:hypothetical protein GQ53DRAFT_505680 [Thozetella sp. PMI_491]
MATVHNGWELGALQNQNGGSQRTSDSAYDPLIYPGLYTRTGLDIMSVLARVHGRPNPQIDIGPVDASCSLVICSLTLPDQPIIYASPSFLAMTGYTLDEILGKNCRFLQAPGGKVRARSSRKHIDKDTVKAMRKAIEKQAEFQVQLPNFKKDGTKFTNFLTIIPLQWDSEDFVMSIGFHCNLDEL